MTKTEALAAIEDSWSALIVGAPWMSDALKVAKEALREMKTDGDLISRQAAIEIIQSMYPGMPRVPWIRKDWQKRYKPYIRAEKAIRELPSAQPEQRWIPCSERLPEKPNMYTVTDSKGDVVRFIFDGTESSREYWLRCAKAWMPLPEPYRADISGKKGDCNENQND